MSINSDRVIHMGQAADRPVPGWTMELSLRSIAVIFPPTFWKRQREAGRAEQEADDLAATIGRHLKEQLGIPNEPSHELEQIAALCVEAGMMPGTSPLMYLQGVLYKLRGSTAGAS